MSHYLQSRQNRDRLCDKFEAAWNQGRTLQVEQFIEQHAESLGSKTIDELIVVEIDLRHALGQDLEPEEYTQRFPSREDAIIFAFERIKEIDQTNVIAATVGASSEPTNGDIPFEQVGHIPDRIGEFRIIQRIGFGSFGVVYKAKNAVSGEEFALKFPRRKAIHCFEELRQIQNEAEAARELEHPAIVKSYGLHEDGGLLFNVQQFVNGEPLAKTKLSDRRAVVEVCAQVAEGLAHAHEKRLIHRDLKPANVLIDENGHPLIADFGLAVHENVQRRMKGQRSGTPAYMSPEQVMGLTHQLDGRSDIWSLGVCLYELLIGRRPFDGDSTEDIYEEIKTRVVKPLQMEMPDLDRELQRICLKCLSKKIDDRYSSASALAFDLRNWLQYEDQWHAQSVKPLIPRGLRSFEPQDADAYAELLPGHRDRFGVPDSIQFWKQKLESLDGAFELIGIGAILGPSGSGKSSFVRAGLLPRLDPNVVRSIYLEATAENTEQRLIQMIDGYEFDIPKNASLPEVFDGLRNRVWSNDHRKLLIVLDQFEQWISAHPYGRNEELVQALRHCDGVHLTCILLFRDEYWLDASRLFDWMGVQWNENVNVQRMDLFDKAHAEEVLYQIGRVLKRLPSDRNNLSSGQTNFLEQVISQLAVGERVICVHMTLFTEMFKNRDWTLNELKKIGGVSGVGEMYLEETFGKSNNSLDANIYSSARLVLESLLPKPGVGIRAKAKTTNQVRDAARHLNDVEFNKLIEILDKELRLITRTRNETNNKKAASNSVDDHYYQLTHDYLVPSIRSWLSRKKRETWRGRAELKLDELTNHWKQRPDKKSLASISDFLKIKLGVDSRRLTQDQIGFLSASSKLHSVRLTFAAVIAAIMLLFFWQFHQSRMQRLAAIEGLDVYFQCPPENAAVELEALESVKRYARGAIKLDHQSPQSIIRYHVALNRLRKADATNMTEIAAVFSAVSANEQMFVLSELARHPELAIAALQAAFDVAQNKKSKNNVELAKLACALLYLTETGGKGEKKSDFQFAESIFSNRKDPTLATLLTHNIVEIFPSSTQLLALIDRHRSNEDLLFGLLIAASEYPSLANDSFPESVQTMTSFIQSEFQNNPDAGIHAACRYLAKKWSIKLPELPASEVPKEGFQWWHTELTPEISMTFVKIEARSFKWRDDRPEMVNLVDGYFKKGGETIIKNDFWIAERETPFAHCLLWMEDEPMKALDDINNFREEKLTVMKKLKNDRYLKNLFDKAKANLPAMGLTYMEIEKMVSWLNKNASEKQAIENQFELSFSSPSQFQLAMRGDSETYYYFGDSSLKKLLPNYGVVIDANNESGQDHTAIVHSAYTRIPSRNGLFDMLGNAGERVRRTSRERDLFDNDDDERSFIAGGNVGIPTKCGTDYFQTERSPTRAVIPLAGFRLTIIHTGNSE